MRSLSFLALALAALPAILALPTTDAMEVTEANTDRFQLYVTDNANISGWAVVNSRVKDGTARLVLQNNSTSTSIVSYLTGSQKQVKLGKQRLNFLVNGKRALGELMVASHGSK
jgi:hypothetical protein